MTYSDYSINEDAVSPVVGVMLMLVIVIVIAALVSAFSGGLMQTDAKAPQASFTGHYSQATGLTLLHTGGESLETQGLKVIVRPSDELGRGQSDYGQILVNTSTLSDVTGAYWVSPLDGTFGVMSWRPGETMYVRAQDIVSSGISSDYPPCYNVKLNGGGNTCYVTSLNNQVNVGKKITVEIVQKSGKLISSTSMMIEP